VSVLRTSLSIDTEFLTQKAGRFVQGYSNEIAAAIGQLADGLPQRIANVIGAASQASERLNLCDILFKSGAGYGRAAELGVRCRGKHSLGGAVLRRWV
jgi:hypothetical protein